MDNSRIKDECAEVTYSFGCTAVGGSEQDRVSGENDTAVRDLVLGKIGTL